MLQLALGGGGGCGHLYAVVIAVFFPGNCLRRVHWISLVHVEEQSPQNTSTDVWLCTFCHVADSCCDIAHTT